MGGWCKNVCVSKNKLGNDEWRELPLSLLWFLTGSVFLLSTNEPDVTYATFICVRRDLYWYKRYSWTKARPLVETMRSHILKTDQVYIFTQWYWLNLWNQVKIHTEPDATMTKRKCFCNICVIAGYQNHYIYYGKMKNICIPIPYVFKKKSQFIYEYGKTRADIHGQPTRYCNLGPFILWIWQNVVEVALDLGHWHVIITT